MFKKLLIVMMITTSLLTTTIAYAEKTLPPMKASVNLGWVLYAYNIGDVMAVKETDTKHNLDFTVVPSGEGIDPIKMLIASQQEFAYSGAADALKAIEAGADIVIIGVKMAQDPSVFISRAEKNIKTPQDWKNKIVGRLPGGSTEYPYQVLLAKSNLSANDFKEVTIPFDMGTFIADKYDVRPAFIFDETVTLDAQNIKYTIINPVDYGVKLVGPVILTKRETIEKNPELVQAFISSLADGTKAALADKQKALDLLVSMDPMLDRDREEKSLNKGVSYFYDAESKRLLYASPAQFEEMQKQLVELKFLKKPVDLSKHLDLRFIDEWQKSQKK